jgi:hypothetical protein
LPAAGAIRRSLQRVDNQFRFPDVYAGSGKWFHGRENCFVIVSGRNNSREISVIFMHRQFTRGTSKALG